MSDNGSQPTEGAMAEKAEKAASIDLTRLSVQARAQGVDAWQPIWFYVAGAADECPAYWSQSRDEYLRKFWKTETLLQGAVYSVISKIKTLGWSLDGPQRQVSRYQDVLANAEFGQGWGVLVSKIVEDLVTTDKGAFVELMRAGAAEGPVLGLAHLDSLRCDLSGDPQYPVIYRNYHTGQPHRLAAHQVLHLSQLPSPDEARRNIGLCAVSRVLRAAQILRDIATYKREKLASRPNRGMYLVNGITQARFNQALAEAEAAQDEQGLTRFAKAVVVAMMDTTQPVSVERLDFASLPDGYDEEQSTTLYAFTMALAFGVDAREFWPATASGATKADALVQAMKARGKGLGDILTSIERALNWAVLPASLTFRFDFQDDEEDRQKADLEGVRIKNVVSLYVPGQGIEGLVSRAEARQMLADLQVLPPEFLAGEPDVTPNVTVDEVEQPKTDVTTSPEETATDTEAAAKELLRLFGPSMRYHHPSGRWTPLEPARPLARGRKAKAQPKTVDLPLPDDVDETTAKLEERLAEAALEALGKTRVYVQEALEKVAGKKALGAKDEPVPLVDDEGFWQEIEKLLGELLLPEVRVAAQAGVAAANQAASTIGVAVDMALVNEPVLKWSREYTFELVRGLNETTRAALREAVVTWQAQGLGKLGLPDLLAALEPLFGKERAELIGSTEVTRCFAEGNALAYQEIPGALGEKWRTAQDERVCFPENTMIATVDGWTPIQDVQQGQLVYTRKGLCPILARTRRLYSGDMVHVKAGSREVIATANHPFWTLEKGWLQGRDLQVGHTLQSLNKELLKVDSVLKLKITDSQITTGVGDRHNVPPESIIPPITRARSVIVHNLQVADAQEFYANGILVHNCPICGALDGRWTKFDDDFNRHLPADVGEGLEKFQRPPAHPRCRCRTTCVMSAPSA